MCTNIRYMSANAKCRTVWNLIQQTNVKIKKKKPNILILIRYLVMWLCQKKLSYFRAADQSIYGYNYITSGICFKITNLEIE